MSGATARVVNKVPRKRSPYPSAIIDSAVLTVAAETSNTITVTGQLKDPNFRNVAVRTSLLAYLASDNLGTILPPALMPTGGYAIGTNGQIRHGAVHNSGLIQKGTLLIDASAAKFKTTTTTIYRAKNAQWTFAATTALTFTAAHIVSASKFGVILIQINAAGTVSSKVSLATQAYNTAPLALAALPLPDADNVAIGYIAIAAGGGGFTANTTALTGISTFVDAAEIGGVPPSFDLVSNASGQFDIVFSELFIKTFYLILVMPDGTLLASGAIGFT